MSEFSADAIKTRVDFSVDDDSAADAGAQRNHNYIADAFGRTGDGFAVSRYVGVVFQVNRLVNPILYILCQRSILKLQIAGIDNGAGFHIHSARSAYAHRLDIVDGEV